MPKKNTPLFMTGQGYRCTFPQIQKWYSTPGRINYPKRIAFLFTGICYILTNWNERPMEYCLTGHWLFWPVFAKCFAKACWKLLLQITYTEWNILCISGSEVYNTICATLNNSLLRGIKQASPVQQTSCLEG